MWTVGAKDDESCLSAGMGLVKIQGILFVCMCVVEHFLFYNIFKLKKVCSTNTR